MVWGFLMVRHKQTCPVFFIYLFFNRVIHKIPVSNFEPVKCPLARRDARFQGSHKRNFSGRLLFWLKHWLIRWLSLDPDNEWWPTFSLMGRTIAISLLNVPSLIYTKKPWVSRGEGGSNHCWRITKKKSCATVLFLKLDSLMDVLPNVYRHKFFISLWTQDQSWCSWQKIP